MARSLRIAVSVFFAVVCVGSLVWWVTSYRVMHSLDLPLTNSNSMLIQSRTGQLVITLLPDPADWELRKYPIPSDWIPRDIAIRWQRPIRRWGRTTLVFPHWFLAFVLAILTATPWAPSFKWRFSLRTLLIAFTLVAVLLGLVTWLAL
jgi:hypothetical protein